MIAMALLPEPRLIIADEPTTALDVTIQAQILMLLRQLAVERGVSVLLTTHDLGTAWEICDRVTVMYAGQALETAPIEAFFHSPALPYTRLLLDSLPSGDAPLRGIPGDVPSLVAPPSGAGFIRAVRRPRRLPETRPPVSEPAPGHSVSCHHALVSAMSEAAPILDLVDVHTHFPLFNAWGRRSGWLRAVDGVSFAVARGEILGIVGESGCGKTTIGKTVAGIHTAASGTIRFEEHDISRLSPRQGREFRKGLQYCYQDPGASLDPHWRIGRSLAEPLIIHTDLPRDQRRIRVREVLAAVGLPEGHLDFIRMRSAADSSGELASRAF